MSTLIASYMILLSAFYLIFIYSYFKYIGYLPRSNRVIIFGIIALASGNLFGLWSDYGDMIERREVRKEAVKQMMIDQDNRCECACTCKHFET